MYRGEKPATQELRKGEELFNVATRAAMGRY